MSFTVGLYDLFSYMIPGILYLYVINETFRLTKLSYIDINQLNNDHLPQIILLAAIAFVVGHLFDYIAHRTWVPFFMKWNKSEEALRQFKALHPEINCQFKSNQYHLLLGALRIRNPQTAETISHLNAISIMFRNISFGLLLLAIQQSTLLVLGQFSFQLFLLDILYLTSSIIAIQRSKLYSFWYFLAIFDTTVYYGNSIEQIFHVSTNLPSASTQPVVSLPPFSPSPETVVPDHQMN